MSFQLKNELISEHFHKQFIEIIKKINLLMCHASYTSDDRVKTRPILWNDEVINGTREYGDNFSDIVFSIIYQLNYILNKTPEVLSGETTFPPSYQMDEFINTAKSIRKTLNNTSGVITDKLDQFRNFCEKFITEECEISDINNFLESVEYILEIIQNIEEFNEFSGYRSRIAKCINIIMDDAAGKKFLEAYDCALKNYNLQTLRELLSDYNKKVVEHWVDYLQNYNNHDSNWCFLGHISGDDYLSNGEYSRKKYVSCSLLDQDHTDTHCGLGYGFMMDPSNIVATYPSDIVSNNYVNSVRELVAYESINPLIELPEVLLSHTGENSTSKYNEVLVSNKDSFAPIGIFCFIDMNLPLEENANYKSALLLQSDYESMYGRHLDIYCYPTMNRNL